MTWLKGILVNCEAVIFFFLFLGCMGGFSIDVSISLLSDKVNDSKAEMDGR